MYHRACGSIVGALGRRGGGGARRVRICRRRGVEPVERCLRAGCLGTGPGEEGGGHLSVEASKVHGREPSERLRLVGGRRGS